MMRSETEIILEDLCNDAAEILASLSDETVGLIIDSFHKQLEEIDEVYAIIKRREKYD